MREFGNTPGPSPWWKRLLEAFLKVFGFGHTDRFMKHDERMRKRRRKTKFDR